MSQTTKRALEASFKKLLLEKPLNKITINDITEDCGVNRMTFYYHFKDIYDLVDWILAEDAAKAMEGRRGFGTWSEAYLDVLRQLQDNKTLVLNVYRSVGREQVEQYLYRLLDPILKDFADRECHDITVQDADKQFVVDFYKYALVGMTLEWTRRDMKGDPKKMVERVSTMIHGDFRRALCRIVQRNAHPAQLLSGHAGLCGCPGRGAAQPLPCRKSRSLLHGKYLHPLPRPGNQCAGRFGCTGPADQRKNRKLSGVFPKLRLSPAGI